MRILVVEDDPTIAHVIEAILQRQQYAVDLAEDGEMGLDLSDSYEYDAIVLDVRLPKLDGIGVCQRIRARGNGVPLLLLTALDTPAERTRGLDAGADDYLGKPFDAEELVARIRALLRRSHTPSEPILTWGPLQLDPVSATVTYVDRLVGVTPKEYALLELFLRNNQRVFSCNAILDHLWAYDDAPSEEAIRTHIKGLRQKLKQAGATSDFIETVYGIGYRLKPINLPEVSLLVETWEKFKGQIHEQVAVLERLSIGFLNQEPQVNWQETGQNIAHSLAGSLGTFGFSLSSELARQIEKLLSDHQNLTLEQGKWLLSSVVALREELEHPISIPDIHPAMAMDNLSGQTHILIVDDDLKILAILQALLQPWGLRITTLSDPREFWTVLTTAQPDLLILDVEMPEIDGLEICQKVRNHPKWEQLPIIFLTAHLEPSLIQQVFAIGADDFVIKPVIGPEIVSRIMNLMENQQARRLQNATRRQFHVSSTALTTHHKTQAMLLNIKHSLQSLQNTQSEESNHGLQAVCAQVEALQQLLLADS
jgi:DNA-binding response OmpR family regulator